MGIRVPLEAVDQLEVFSVLRVHFLMYQSAALVRLEVIQLPARVLAPFALLEHFPVPWGQMYVLRAGHKVRVLVFRIFQGMGRLQQHRFTRKHLHFKSAQISY